MIDTRPVAGIVREAELSEAQILANCRDDLSVCSWRVGKWASLWVRKYARGRTDADFAQQVGLSGDQVRQRRQVWETFADVRGEYTHLTFSHFYAALTWDDSTECLKWADEQQATVAEMKAWRRAMRGEDLTQQPGGEGESEAEDAENGLPERANGNPSATQPSSSGPSGREARDQPDDAPARTKKRAAQGAQPDLPPDPGEDVASTELTVERSEIDTYVLELRRMAKEVEKKFPIGDEAAEFADECRSVAQRLDPAGRQIIKKFDPREIALPVVLHTDEFVAAWRDFCDFRRKEKRKPISETEAQAKLKEWSKFPAAVVVAAIRETIVQGWQGVFPEKVKLGGSGANTVAAANQRSEDRLSLLGDFARGDE